MDKLEEWKAELPNDAACKAPGWALYTPCPDSCPHDKGTHCEVFNPGNKNK